MMAWDFVVLMLGLFALIGWIAWIAYKAGE